MSYIGVQAQNHVSPAFHREVVTPDGSASFFDLVQDVPGFNADNVLVVVNNVVQHPYDSYTIKADANGNPRRLDFAGSVPAATDTIYVTHRGVGTLNITPAAGTVDSVALADNLRSGVVNSFTGSQATNSSTQLTLTEAPLNAQSIMVYVNGVYQKPTTNYTVSGTTLTFTGALVSSDEIDVHHLSIRTGVTHVADGSVTSAKLDTNLSLDGNLTVGGTLGITGATTLTGAVTVPTPTTSSHPTTKAYVDADIVALRKDIATLALYRAADHSKAYYNLVDQVIDTFTDATGIDASASTGEGLESGAFAGQGAGLSFRYLKLFITAADFHDANAGAHVLNFLDDSGTDGTHSATITSTGSGVNADHIPITATGSWWFTTGSSTTQYGIADFGSIKTGVTKIYAGKMRTNGDPRKFRIAWSLDDSTYNFVQFPSSGMTYNASKAGISFNFARESDTTLTLTAFSSNGEKGYSSIQGGTNWTSAYGGGDLTLVSISHTASSAPTKGDLVMMIENAKGTATLNTDVKGYISRDGGTTYTQGTLVDEGSWGTNKKILAFHNLDISGQPSGTAVRYKITTHNQSTASKNTRIHGTSVAWA
tara:strand:+ start:1110 stop:2891 length:1782 start_codon:yes stop_codon:yes gene_type:complete